MSEDKQRYCSGCRDDFYNHRSEPGFDGATKCWSLATAKVVTRFRIDYWTTPDTPGAFCEVTTLDCHYAPGKYAHTETVPRFAVDVKRLQVKS